MTLLDNKRITSFTDKSYCYCGRIWTPLEIEWIRQLIASSPNLSRFKLSQIVCDQFQWLRPDGQGKAMSCRVAMLRMHRDDLICLPPAKHKNVNGNNPPELSRQEKITCTVVPPIHLD